MKYDVLGLGVALVATLAGCNVDKNATSESATLSNELRLEKQVMSFKEGRCDSVVQNGATVRASYYVAAGNETAARAINDTLRTYLLASLRSALGDDSLAARPADLHQTARLFGQQYRKVKQEMPDAPGCWAWEADSDTLPARAGVLTVQVSGYSFMGGAHPNSFITYYNFDRATGRVLSLADVGVDRATLLTVAERAFRNQQGLQPTDDLEKAGYFLSDNKRFFLPHNVAFGRDSLILLYNQYEIAPYVMGQIRVAVPYKLVSGRTSQVESR